MIKLDIVDASRPRVADLPWLEGVRIEGGSGSGN